MDCGFCRSLHSDIERLLQSGIEVRYLAFPRGGEASESFDKMVSVWCSDDRQRAITQAKRGQNLPMRDCESPVLAHYRLGVLLGISGTPAIITSDGDLIAGYAGFETLLASLGL